MKNIACWFLLVVLFLLVFSVSAISAQEQKKINNEREKVEKKTGGGDRWIALDKFLHFTASAGVTGLSYHFYHCQFNNPEKNSLYFSISVAGLAGIGKECYDVKYRKTGWSWKDITVDAAGIAFGYLLFIKLHISEN